jgi:hypothetical protein
MYANKFRQSLVILITFRVEDADAAYPLWRLISLLAIAPQSDPYIAS